MKELKTKLRKLPKVTPMLGTSRTRQMDGYGYAGGIGGYGGDDGADRGIWGW